MSWDLAKVSGLLQDKWRSWNSKPRPRDFPDGQVVQNLLCNTGDAGSVFGQVTKIPRRQQLESARLNEVPFMPQLTNMGHVTASKKGVLSVGFLLSHSQEIASWSYTLKKIRLACARIFFLT